MGRGVSAGIQEQVLDAARDQQLQDRFRTRPRRRPRGRIGRAHATLETSEVVTAMTVTGSVPLPRVRHRHWPDPAEL